MDIPETESTGAEEEEATEAAGEDGEGEEAPTKSIYDLQPDDE